MNGSFAAGAVHVFIDRRLEPGADPHAALGEQFASMPCLELHRIRHVESFLSDDAERVICHFLAPDAETMRRLLRRRLPR